MLVRGLLVVIAMARLLCAQTVEERARGILDAKCTSCHGAAQMAGLDLRTREGLLRGGTRGAALAANGDVDASLLLKAVRREGELQMPPGKTALTAAEVAVLREWVAAGAPYSGQAKRSAEPAWWAFRKIGKPALPAGAAKNAVDRFVAAKLREKGLRPLGRADRRTLIRRATFDLHGLPPAAEEIAAFEADASPEAWEKLIDRLLASPRYGRTLGTPVAGRGAIRRDGGL
jgi:hypothetical protein